MPQTFDVVIIGGGIAGASLAYQLSARQRVLVLEREPQAGYHATGRSAALFSTTYGNATIRSLSRLSEDFFRAPPPGFSPVPLLKARGALLIARAEQRALLSARLASCDIESLEGAALYALAPVLRPDCIAAALWEAGASDVDVAALHEGYLRALRERSACEVRLGCGAQEIEPRGSGWRISAGAERYDAALLVNAGGAWADEVARQAGVEPLRLAPKKRTAAVVATTEPVAASLPMVIDAAETFYFKPDAGRLLVSPADEADSAPGDVWAEDLDVALAVERLEAVTTLTVQKVVRAWAGLRTFAADRSPVVGFEPGCAGFFWLAAQGGYGIQTAPAVSALAAHLIDARLGVAAAPALRSALDPARLRA